MEMQVMSSLIKVKDAEQRKALNAWAKHKFIGSIIAVLVLVSLVAVSLLLVKLLIIMILVGLL